MTPWKIDLKKGMELAPWTSCIGRLATTPAEARSLLRNAAAIVQARASHLTATGKRTWEPSRSWPALIIVIDEYAELAEHAAAALPDADSIARLGRATAVTLIAATQRPTQQAMGQRAIRSQMDVRIAFRVREKGDADLILGRGMRTAGWHADSLNAPGKFLISAPEYDVPRRARAYLLTDEMVTRTADAHAQLRPELDYISARAILGGDADCQHGEMTLPERQPESAENPDSGTSEIILWAALAVAPPEGVSIGDLVAETGMSQRWVHYRLRALADAGRALQVRRGVWRAVSSEGDAP